MTLQLLVSCVTIILYQCFIGSTVILSLPMIIKSYSDLSIYRISVGVAMFRDVKRAGKAVRSREIATRGVAQTSQGDGRSPRLFRLVALEERPILYNPYCYNNHLLYF
jgi:hypothetical protein